MAAVSETDTTIVVEVTGDVMTTMAALVAALATAAAAEVVTRIDTREVHLLLLTVAVIATMTAMRIVTLTGTMTVVEEIDTPLPDVTIAIVDVEAMTTTIALLAVVALQHMVKRQVEKDMVVVVVAPSTITLMTGMPLVEKY